jgi:hypothetical protein
MDAAGIEWLLRGLPDLCFNEEEEDLLRETPDNDLVSRILKEGGTPPSQLQFPSIYAESQKRMVKLPLARRLRINLNSFLVYSAKFGMRKDNSFMVIHLPSGVKDPNYEAGSTIVVPLHELKPSTVSASRAKIRKPVNVLQDYFVGKVSFGMDKSFHWDVELSDSVLRNWMCARLPYSKNDFSSISADRRGFIRVEFVSMLTPSDGRRSGLAKRPTHDTDPMSNSVCIGYLDVPLCGLLNASRNFDVLVSSQVLLDPSTHAAISHRLDRLPAGPSEGHYAKSAEEDAASGENLFLGTLNLRLSLLDQYGAVLPIDDHVETPPFDENVSARSKHSPILVESAERAPLVAAIPVDSVKPHQESSPSQPYAHRSGLDKGECKEAAFLSASEFVPSESPVRPSVEYPPLTSLPVASDYTNYLDLKLNLRSVAIDFGHVLETSAGFPSGPGALEYSVAIDYKIPSENER